MSEGNKRTWSFKGVTKWLSNALKAVVMGEFWLRFRVSRYFIHILYTFFLFWLSIYLSIKIEGTMMKVEENRNTLREKEIVHTQKTIELARMGRMSKIENMLESAGSEVGIPDKPAERIKK